MTVFQSVVLGLVQGLTEFLPVSSSGHLVIIEKLFGLSPSMAFVVLAHLGTLLAVVVYFYRDIIALSLSFLAGIKKITIEFEHPRAVYYHDTNFKICCFLALGTIATAAIALPFKDIFESMFSSVFWVGVSWLATFVLIMAAEAIGKGKRFPVQMNFADAIFIGLFQGIAVAPGLSRSGATISAALMSGLERRFAARFSFLLSIPAIIAASAFELKDIFELGIAGIGMRELIIGFCASFFAGMLAIRLFLEIVSRTSIRVFAYYCLVLGVIAIIISRA